MGKCNCCSKSNRDDIELNLESYVNEMWLNNDRYTKYYNTNIEFIKEDNFVTKQRLEILKSGRLFTEPIFEQLSEMTHYEIFKYLNSQDLLEIRALNLAGYQLTSKHTLRARIANYLIKFQFGFTGLIEENIEKVRLMFEQTGKNAFILENTSISHDDIIIISLTLKSIPKTSQLYLNNNKLGVNGTCLFAETLQFVNNITLLCLNSNQTGNIGAKAIGEKLKAIPHLQELYLKSNSIGNSGVKILADNFHFVDKLRILDLGLNRISDLGLANIEENLIFIPNIKIINLEGNHIEEKLIENLNEYIYYMWKTETI